MTAGDKLGHYEILAPIGAGGMGEVYRARDTRLKREVALKVLPEAFANDPGRMMRFQREAEVLASLNHPNIAQIYGVEERALAMELVEGESPKGPIPFESAWKIAMQIANALEYAHDKGVIHRDLKPANVKVTPEGVVKLLDFGLAKAYSGQPDNPSGDPSLSPTITLGATVAGTILGTAAYMSPEQARGKNVDKRADIWAWGVALYELLTGEQMFQGEDAAETLGAVMHKQPDLDRVPPQARKLLGRCLEKDPKKRLRDIGDAKDLLEETAPFGHRPETRVRAVPWMVAGICAIAAVAAGAWAFLRQPVPDMHSLRYSIEAPPNTTFYASYFGSAVSPDGRLLAFGAAPMSAGGTQRMWLRPMDSLAAREVPGTDNANGMFWSPDSKSVGFAPIGQNQLKRVDVLGGLPQMLCDAPDFDGGSWGQDGTILFSANHVIERVSAAGGEPVPVTSLDASRGETAHRNPYLLPDGKSFLFTILSSNPATQGIYVASIDAPKQRIRLAASNAKAMYAPPRDGFPGYLLWLRDQTLVAQRFDGKARLEGDPIPVADQIGQNGGNLRTAFWISNTGLLLYRSGTVDAYQLDWIGREGKPEVVAGAGADKSRGDPRLSPDGAKVAFDQRPAAGPAATSDIWLYEFARGGVLTRLTTGPGNNDHPVWSPDGRWVAFRSDRGGASEIYRKETSGTGQDEQLTRGGNPKIPLDWSRDGRYILYQEPDPKNGDDIWALPLEGDRKPIAVLNTRFNERQAQFSPDGKWIVYASDESGSYQIYVQPFPPSGGKITVTNDGGYQPRWEGNEIFYYCCGGTRGMWAAGIKEAAGRVNIDTPRQLMIRYARFSDAIHYDVTRDGQRFLEIQPEGAAAEDQFANALTVVSNWQAGLRQ